MESVVLKYRPQKESVKYVVDKYLKDEISIELLGRCIEVIVEDDKSTKTISEQLKGTIVSYSCGMQCEVTEDNIVVMNWGDE